MMPPSGNDARAVRAVHGQTLAHFSNRKGMGRHYQSASYPHHRLSAVRIEGTPPYQGQPSKINALWFGFSPLPDYYEPK